MVLSKLQFAVANTCSTSQQQQGYLCNLFNKIFKVQHVFMSVEMVAQGEFAILHIYIQQTTFVFFTCTLLCVAFFDPVGGGSFWKKDIIYKENF